MNPRVLVTIMIALVVIAAATMAEAQTVKVTALGSRTGEFCSGDRAFLFEDPTGVRILYDPGRTIDGGTDGRLGTVHVMLLSHGHTDHIGDTRPNSLAPGTCANPGTVSAAPNTNFAAIAAAKSAAVLAGGEMADFLTRKIQNIQGTAPAACPAVGLRNEIQVPLASACTAALRPGGSRTIRLAGETAGVKIASTPAFHSNGINAAYVDTPGVAPGTATYGGSEGGFIIQFTNGLRVYLSGDTGLFGDMDTIIRGYYRPMVAVLNVSDTVTLGPDEAAFAATTLLKVRTVIPSHINEAATSGGAPAGDRMLRFLDQMKDSGIKVVIPLSGVGREFDGFGRCVNCT